MLCWTLKLGPKMHVFIKNASNHLDHMRLSRGVRVVTWRFLFNLKSCDWHSNFIQSTFGERKYSPPKFSHHLEKFWGCYFTLKCTLLLLNITRTPCRLQVKSNMDFKYFYDSLQRHQDRYLAWPSVIPALGRWQIRIGFELDETFSFL